MFSSFADIKNMNIEDGFLKEYISFKEEYPYGLLFFQIGSFYECFCEDAYLLSRICNLNCSTRKAKNIGEIFQVGIPVKFVDNFIKKILNENIKIVICDQITEENQTKHCVSRVYTKGTVLESEFLDSSENNYIVAIRFDENNSSLSYADVSTGQFYKTVATKEQIYFEVEKILPDEILILNSQKDEFKNLNFENNITYLDDNEYFHLSSDEILLKYCRLMQLNFFSKLDDIIHYDINYHLTMDEITRINLEISRTKRNLKKKGSLLWFLNQTKTPMGIRLLKKYIDEPLLDVNEIYLRQEAVEELSKNKIILNELLFLLQEFSDLSRICAQILNSTIYPKALFSIIRNAKTIQKINELCLKFNSKLLKLNQKEIQSVKQFANLIENSILENSADELKNGSIIKDGYNSNLDYLKSKLNNCLKDLDKFALKLQNKFKNNKIKVDYSRLIGYYIEFPISIQNFAPDDFIKKQTLNTCVRYTNFELKKIEEEILNLRFKINDLEYELFCEIRNMATKFAEQVRNIAKDIAKIDVFCSFAKIAVDYGFTKPKFNNEKIEIINGYHPSLIKLNNEIIKNDTLIKNGELNILTGANMSGKSTFLKHNGLISILSQIGSFVPCDCANLTIVDKIFLRQGSTDDIVNNNSSFMVEMNDLKFILENMTNSSLVLLDEPAKSTNQKEGGVIARAFLEYLIRKFKSKIIVATHNLEITKLENDYPSRAINLVIGNVEADNYINNRKIQRGVIEKSFAINTALLADLPKEIIDKAKEYIG